jgi:hypothetical protein
MSEEDKRQCERQRQRQQISPRVVKCKVRSKLMQRKVVCSRKQWMLGC